MIGSVPADGDPSAAWSDAAKLKAANLMARISMESDDIVIGGGEPSRACNFVVEPEEPRTIEDGIAMAELMQSGIEKRVADRKAAVAEAERLVLEGKAAIAEATDAAGSINIKD